MHFLSDFATEAPADLVRYIVDFITYWGSADYDIDVDVQISDVDDKFENLTIKAHGEESWYTLHVCQDTDGPEIDDNRSDFAYQGGPGRAFARTPSARYIGTWCVIEQDRAKSFSF